MKSPSELSEKEKKATDQTNKKEDRQSSNPFKLRIGQSQSSNPFRMKIGENENSQKLFQTQKIRTSIEQIKKRDIQQSNPFKIRVNQIEKTNPFKMDLGDRKDSKQFFVNQQTQKSDQIFQQIIEENNKNVDQKQLLPLPKLKSQSKLESIHYQQNVKNYKELLRTFYNSKYRTKVHSLEQVKKRWKKQGNNMNQGISQQLKIPQNYIISKRLVFTKKQQKFKAINYHKLQEYYLISLVKNKHFVIYQLKQPSLKSLKPIQLRIQQPDISSSVQYDPHYGRIFYFSNLQQQIVVIGVKALQVICRVKIKYKRTNPLLYINKYKSNLYLLVIGGYRVLADSIVEGSKYIQVFSISKWQISLKQVLLRLGIGRISPIIFSCQYQNEPCLFIIGGSSNAEIDNKNRLKFFINQDINFSTNQTGIRIASSFVEDCFSGDDSNYLLLTNNINIRFNNPLELYGGTVLFRKLSKVQKIELFFLNKKQIHAIKIIKNDVHIIQSELAVKISLQKQQNGTLNKSIGYHRDLKNSFQLYGISSQGRLLPIQVTLNSKIKVKQQCMLI